MTKENKNEKESIWKKFEGKKVLILTKFSIHYTTNNILVTEEGISFIDKYGYDVVLALSEIAQITEVKEND